MTDYASMSFDDLRTIHREISGLLAQKRHEAFEQLKNQMSLLGFAPEDFGGPKKKRGRRPKSSSHESDNFDS